MKTYLVIASLAGISLVGTFGLWHAGNHHETEPEVPVTTVLDPDQSIEIIGLDSPVDGLKPIRFSVLAHKFSGCTSVGVLVFREMHYHSPVLQKQFVTECSDGAKTMMREYSFPVVINSTDLESGWYIARASYFAGRDMYGELERKFVITKTPVLDSTMPSRIMTNQYVLEILNLQANYLQDVETKFVVHERGIGINCYSIYAEILDSSGNRIWGLPKISKCPRGIPESEYDQKIPFSGIKIGKAGEYWLVVQSRGYEIMRTFSILNGNLIR